MTDWYYAVDGVQCGPVTAEELRQLLVEKRIEREDLVWTPALPAWCAASSVPELAGGATPLFAVSNLKLALMMFSTFGVYQIFWFFKHWKAIQARTGQDLIPLARGIFAIFFFHLLVREVNESAAAHDAGRQLPVAPLTTLFVILIFTQRLPDPFWLLCFLVMVPLMLVQDVANHVNRKAAPLADRNGRIRGWNWLAVLLGIPLFVLALIGTFMPQ